MLKDQQVALLFSGNIALASLVFGSLLGIMDPDSKSAASWGDASKGPQRQPVEEAVWRWALGLFSTVGPGFFMFFRHYSLIFFEDFIG